MHRVRMVARLATTAVLMMAVFGGFTASAPPASAYPTALDNLATATSVDCCLGTACYNEGTSWSFCAAGTDPTVGCVPSVGNLSCYWCTY